MLRLLLLAVLALAACAGPRSLGGPPGVDGDAEGAPPEEAADDDAPLHDCTGFAEAEEARRLAHTGPCPFCPCACSAERGVFCAPCVECPGEQPEPPALPAPAPPRPR